MSHTFVIGSLAILELALLALVIALECREARRNAEELRILRRILGPDYIDRDAINRCYQMPPLTYALITMATFVVATSFLYR